VKRMKANKFEKAVAKDNQIRRELGLPEKEFEGESSINAIPKATP
jgi:hypothetical protein